MISVTKKHLLRVAEAGQEEDWEAGRHREEGLVDRQQRRGVQLRGRHLGVGLQGISSGLCINKYLHRIIPIIMYQI